MPAYLSHIFLFSYQFQPNIDPCALTRTVSMTWLLWMKTTLQFLLIMTPTQVDQLLSRQVLLINLLLNFKGTGLGWTCDLNKFALDQCASLVLLWCGTWNWEYCRGVWYCFLYFQLKIFVGNLKNIAELISLSYWV